MLIILNELSTCQDNEFGDQKVYLSNKSYGYIIEHQAYTMFTMIMYR